MRKLILALALTIVLSTGLVAGTASAAWKPFGGVQCQGSVNNSAVCQDAGGASGNNPLTGDGGLLSKVTGVVALITGFAAVLVIFLAGLRLVQSSGNAEDIAGARRAIIYALVGLVVVILARTLILFVVGAL